MSNTPFPSQHFAAFAAAVRASESGDDYTSHPSDVQAGKGINRFFGAYQMSYVALADAGFIEKSTDLTSPTWTPFARSLGINSMDAFLASQKAQDIAFQRNAESNDHYLRNYKAHIGKLITSKVTGIPVYVTQSGLLAAAHLRGYPAVEEFLSSNGAIDREDGYDVHVSEYAAGFAGHGFTFDHSGSPVDTPDTPAVLTAPGITAAARFEARRDAEQKAIKREQSGGGKTRQAAPLAPVRHQPGAKKSLQAALRSGGVGAAERPAHRVGGASSGQIFASLMQEVRLAARRLTRAMAIIRKVLEVRATGRPDDRRIAKTSALSRGRLAALRAGTLPLRRFVSASSLRPTWKSFDQRAPLRTVAGSGWKRASKGRPADSLAFARPPGDAIHSARADKAALPSFAPPGLALRLGTNPAGQVAPRAADANSIVSQASTKPKVAAYGTVDQRQLGRALAELLDQQGRLPPTGATGFDARLTPAWAGQKLPA
jgi:hypothetical protein